MSTPTTKAALAEVFRVANDAGVFTYLCLKGDSETTTAESISSDKRLVFVATFNEPIPELEGQFFANHVSIANAAFRAQPFNRPDSTFAIAVNSGMDDYDCKWRPRVLQFRDDAGYGHDFALSTIGPTGLTIKLPVDDFSFHPDNAKLMGLKSLVKEFCNARKEGEGQTTYRPLINIIAQNGDVLAGFGAPDAHGSALTKIGESDCTWEDGTSNWDAAVFFKVYSSVASRNCRIGVQRSALSVHVKGDHSGMRFLLPTVRM